MRLPIKRDTIRKYYRISTLQFIYLITCTKRLGPSFVVLKNTQKRDLYFYIQSNVWMWCECGTKSTRGLSGLPRATERFLQSLELCRSKVVWLSNDVQVSLEDAVWRRCELSLENIFRWRVVSCWVIKCFWYELTVLRLFRLEKASLRYRCFQFWAGLMTRT